MTDVTAQDFGVKRQTTKTVQWAGLTGGDTGLKVDLSNYPDKTVQVIGPTFDGAVTVRGSNDGTNFEVLTDALGNALSFTSAGMKLISENALWVEIAVAAGTSENTVILTASN